MSNTKIKRELKLNHISEEENKIIETIQHLHDIKTRAGAIRYLLKFYKKLMLDKD